MNRPVAVLVSACRLAFTIGLIIVMLMSGCSSSDDDTQEPDAMDTSPLIGPVWIWDGYQIAEEPEHDMLNRCEHVQPAGLPANASARNDDTALAWPSKPS